MAVIGAGNVAFDAARSAIRNGAEKVTIIYRKGYEDMPATKHEIHEALEDGISFNLYNYPIEIKENGVWLGKVVRLESAGPDGQDGFIQKFDERTFFESDSTIVAISQVARNNIVKNTTELNTSQVGLLIADQDGRTTKPGTFASGDVVTGAKTVVEAIAHAKNVAESMDQYCQSLKSCMIELTSDCDSAKCEENAMFDCMSNWAFENN